MSQRQRRELLEKGAGAGYGEITLSHFHFSLTFPYILKQLPPLIPQFPTHWAKGGSKWTRGGKRKGGRRFPFLVGTLKGLLKNHFSSPHSPEWGMNTRAGKTSSKDVAWDKMAPHKHLSWSKRLTGMEDTEWDNGRALQMSDTTDNEGLAVALR